LKALQRILFLPLILLVLVWACAALWFDGPASRPLAVALMVACTATTLALLARAQPLGRGLVVSCLPLLAVAAWWLSLEPSSERDWLPDVARLPAAQFDGDHVTVRNVRNFEYRSEADYTERWEERHYDLSQLTGVDIFLSYWGSPWIAHTVMSWSFADGQQLAVSIETRKERHEEYSAVRGFFRQFELYYVVADERDVIGVRTSHRGEDVYLYRLKMPAERARALLVDYLNEINRLAREPDWYNAATHNCTTTIRRHMQAVSAGNPWDWRILVNGRIDELGYERGTIETSLPFAELRRRSAISERAKLADPEADFSEWIRAGLPGHPAAP